MRTENTAPVTLAEGQAVLDQLRELYERSEHNGQTMFAFVFQLAEASLADNLATAADEVDHADG
ncbi:hypothetical protein ACXU4B_03670 [Dyella soli]|uniref:Uncharacterized protein n=1 Tax=Dyella soli TaxID=522319 RepID=A0A4R0YMM9_9GAMM|nr:hypothetical protein [Dyella soli]TCI10137.1 hypothetical protein EZM97_14555 [Dyella soli]